MCFCTETHWCEFSIIISGMQVISEEHVKFGTHLKKLREEKGLSLNIFCFENDLNKGEISKIERGIIDFKFSTINKIAKSLDIPLYKLLDYNN